MGHYRSQQDGDHHLASGGILILQPHLSEMIRSEATTTLLWKLKGATKMPKEWPGSPKTEAAERGGTKCGCKTKSYLINAKRRV